MSFENYFIGSQINLKIRFRKISFKYWAMRKYLDFLSLLGRAPEDTSSILKMNFDNL